MKYFTSSLRTIAIGVVLTVFLLNSLGCKSTNGWKLGTLAEPIPVVFKTTPTLEEIKTELNHRTAKIESLSSDNATLTAGNTAIPLRSCSVAVQHPKNIRVRGGTGLGTEIDFGSNNEQFWFWAKRMPEKEIYYANHEQFAASPVRSAIPFDPNWLMESLGLITLKDTDRHEGPTRTTDGHLQVTSYLQTPSGTYTRIITLNPQTAAITKHEIYDPNGRPLIATSLSKHAIDPSTGILFAGKMEIFSTSSQDTFVLNLGNPKFNTPGGFSSLAFTMPSYPGYIPTDLCGPDFQQRIAQNTGWPQQQINQTTYSGPAPANPGLGIGVSPIQNPNIQGQYQGQYINQAYHVPAPNDVSHNVNYPVHSPGSSLPGTAHTSTYIRAGNY